MIRAVDLDENFTYRIFNDGKWNRGGRLYGGWWQNIPSKQRQHILINGEPTVELDFCTQSLVLLYAIEGIHFGDSGVDGYEVPDRKGKVYPRDVVKELFTIAVNTASANSTISAFINDRKKKENTAHEQGDSFTSFTQLDRKDCQQVLDTFLSAHAPIAHHLFRGKDKGLYLQYLDSQIADEILRLMTKAKIPVLCVHDSFIVAAQHEVDLVQAISLAYSRVLREKLDLTTKGLLWLKRTDGDGCEKFQIEVPPLTTPTEGTAPTKI